MTSPCVCAASLLFPCAADVHSTPHQAAAHELSRRIAQPLRAWEGIRRCPAGYKGARSTRERYGAGLDWAGRSSARRSVCPRAAACARLFETCACAPGDPMSSRISALTCAGDAIPSINHDEGVCACAKERGALSLCGAMTFSPQPRRERRPCMTNAVRPVARCQVGRYGVCGADETWRRALSPASCQWGLDLLGACCLEV